MNYSDILLRCRSMLTFVNSQNVCNRDSFTTKYFYDIFLKKKFITPAIQIKYAKEFNLTKQDWENIYMNKIYRIKDKKIAEFNYKLIDNILFC